MKALLLLPLSLLLSCTETTTERAPERNSFISTFSDDEHLVYICESPNAYAYHSDEDCEWLNGCSYDISEISLSDAEENDRKECSKCY